MRVQNFINNQWCDAQSHTTFEVENPFTEEIIASVPASDVVDIDRAVQSAREAFDGWRQLTVD